MGKRGNKKLNKTILLDCDGILCDFVSGALKAHEREHEGHDSVTTWDFFEKWGLTAKEFYDKVRGRDFWLNLKPYEDGLAFYGELSKKTTPVISTAPIMDPECVQAKIEWLYTHYGVIMTNIMVGSQKHLMANPNTLLIDDNPSNVQKFLAYGGKAVLIKKPWNDGLWTYDMTLDLIDSFLAGEIS